MYRANHINTIEGKAVSSGYIIPKIIFNKIIASKQPDPAKTARPQPDPRFDPPPDPRFDPPQPDPGQTQTSGQTTG